ncbi:MAG: DUF2779 domain-containing protein [Candidatus Odinarchaeota archaeon]
MSNEKKRRRRLFTKDMYKKARECPTKLFYLDKPYKKRPSSEAMLESIQNAGHVMGEAAKCLYPDGIDLKHLDPFSAIKETEERLKCEKIVIFEAAFRYGPYLARPDILVKTGNSIGLLEVKSKTLSAGEDVIGKKGWILAKWKPLIEDIAYQKELIEQCRSEFHVTPYLIVLDRDKKIAINNPQGAFEIIREGSNVSLKLIDEKKAIMLSELLTKLLVQEFVDLLVRDKDINDLMSGFAFTYLADKKIKPYLGDKCKRCEYRVDDGYSGTDLKNGFLECLKDVTGCDDCASKPTVFDLWNYRNTWKLLKNGTVFMEDIDLSIFDISNLTSRRQLIQINKLLTENEHEFIDPTLFKEMDSWIYPVHLVDFETAQPVIPLHAGRSPSDVLAYQFSNHTVYEDGTIEHSGEWITLEPGTFPNYDFIRELKKLFSKDHGTVLHYARHERIVLEEIQEQLRQEIDVIPDARELVTFIDSLITERMVDMLKMVKHYYYHPLTKGMNSIKKVTPAILETSSFLQKKYSEPYRGSNFPKGIVWYQKEENGKGPKQLYDLLIEYNRDGGEEEKGLDINKGDMAMLAYIMSQTDEMTDREREQIRQGLLRYCELDTLAMVMILEYWRKLSEEKEEISRRYSVYMKKLLRISSNKKKTVKAAETGRSRKPRSEKRRKYSKDN